MFVSRFPSWSLRLLWLIAASAVAYELFPRIQQRPYEWREASSFEAPEARQAAAADANYVYAISSKVVAKYDRNSKQLLARSQGEASHLNSGFLHDGRVYLAHSNYPQQPEHSEIKVLDPATMQLAMWHDFGASEGSLTWCVRDEEGAWWCNFAYYGEQNSKTYVAKFVDWHEVGRWTYPAQVIKAFGTKSSSGGVLRGRRNLMVTGHDEREIYLLRLPADPDVHILEYFATKSVPFTGQGIAIDPATFGLVGIDRAKRRVIFATRPFE